MKRLILAHVAALVIGGAIAAVVVLRPLFHLIREAQS